MYCHVVLSIILFAVLCVYHSIYPFYGFLNLWIILSHLCYHSVCLKLQSLLNSSIPSFYQMFYSFVQQSFYQYICHSIVLLVHLLFYLALYCSVDLSVCYAGFTPTSKRTFTLLHALSSLLNVFHLKLICFIYFIFYFIYFFVQKMHLNFSLLRQTHCTFRLTHI